MPTARERIVLGQIVRIDESYARQLRVPPVVLFSVLATAAVIDVLVLLLATVFRAKAPVASRPGIKALRKGPEFMVTPIWVRDADDSLVELEVHGHLNASALVRTDRIRTIAYRQKGRDVPFRVGDLENLTTGRITRPRRATLWTHFGAPLMIQAMLGALLLTLVPGYALLNAVR
jgi:hypothetical protein